MSQPGIAVCMDSLFAAAIALAGPPTAVHAYAATANCMKSSAATHVLAIRRFNVLLNMTDETIIPACRMPRQFPGLRVRAAVRIRLVEEPRRHGRPTCGCPGIAPRS